MGAATVSYPFVLLPFGCVLFCKLRASYISEWGRFVWFCNQYLLIRRTLPWISLRHPSGFLNHPTLGPPPCWSETLHNSWCDYVAQGCRGSLNDDNFQWVCLLTSWNLFDKYVFSWVSLSTITHWVFSLKSPSQMDVALWCYESGIG